MKNPFRENGWKEVEATVSTCGGQDHYNPGMGPASVQSDYLITFSYEVDGQWYSGEFNSASPRAEGSRFTILYDPNNPEHNNMSMTDAENRWTNIIVGIIGAIVVIVLIWTDRRHHH